MDRRQGIGMVFVLSVCLLWAGTVLAGSGAAIDWWTVCSGGQTQSGTQTLTAIVGQPMVFASAQGNQALCAGFACGAIGSAPQQSSEDPVFLYLPAVQNH